MLTRLMGPLGSSRLLVACLLWSLSARAAPGQEPASSEDLPIPTDLAAKVDQAVTLGREIYLQDKAANVATSALTRKLGSLGDEGLGAHLAVRETGDQGPLPFWVVSFFTDEEIPRVAYRVRVSMTGGMEPLFRRVSPPGPAGPGAQIVLRARRTAIAAVQPLEQPVHAVFLPGSAIDRIKRRGKPESE